MIHKDKSESFYFDKKIERKILRSGGQRADVRKGGKVFILTTDQVKEKTS